MYRSWSKRLSMRPLPDEAPPPQRRPTSVYVPTHAASSFVQTVSQQDQHEPRRKKHRAPPLVSDYATFLVEAEANDRALRSCIAHRKLEQRRERPRDSAYYSGSSSSRSDEKVVEERLVPKPPKGSGLTRRGTKTLGRRLSEYFKPPTRRAAVC